MPFGPGLDPGLAGHLTRRHVAILGLGEAGTRYARDLVAAGWKVAGYDPAPVRTPDGVGRAASAAEAVGDAEIVLALTGSRFAVDVAGQVRSSLRAGTCFADFNSASASTKRAVAEALGGSGAEVADVAVLAPIPRRGAATPLIVSGPGAGKVAAVFGDLGAVVDVLDAPVGAAAGRKLLRSVFMKGMAATVIEAVSAGAAAGCEDWLRQQIASELGPDGPALVERLIEGTRAHAQRRVHEMTDSQEYLRELGVPTPICDATLQWLGQLASEH